MSVQRTRAWGSKCVAEYMRNSGSMACSPTPIRAAAPACGYPVCSPLTARFGFFIVAAHHHIITLTHSLPRFLVHFIHSPDHSLHYTLHGLQGRGDQGRGAVAAHPLAGARAAERTRPAPPRPRALLPLPVSQAGARAQVSRAAVELRGSGRKQWQWQARQAAHQHGELHPGRARDLRGAPAAAAALR